MNYFPSWLRIPVIFFIIFGLTEYFVGGDKPAIIEHPITLLFLLFALALLIGIEGIRKAIENVLYQTLDDEAKARYNVQKEEPSKFIAWVKKTYKKLLGSKPIEEEHDIILDHNYDGIKELDNNLPPWWLYMFYATMVFAFIYLVKYQVFNGDNQFDELETEYAIAEKEIAEYKKTAKNLVDFNTVEVLTEASDLSAGKNIFNQNCVACHKADGGGGIGPNLTDKHWILGGGIKNVFKTISEGGRDGKGMVAWKANLKPVQIAQVASYVLQFQGTTPAEPKAPQGDIWVDKNAPKTEATTTPEVPSEETIEEDKTAAKAALQQ